MSHAEFRHWLALYRIEPWGDEWDQTRAVSASTLAPWNKKIARKLPKFFPKPPRATPQQVEQKLMMFARRHNRAFEKRQKHQGGEQWQSSAILPSPSPQQPQGCGPGSDPPPV